MNHKKSLHSASWRHHIIIVSSFSRACLAFLRARCLADFVSLPVDFVMVGAAYAGGKRD